MSRHVLGDRVDDRRARATLMALAEPGDLGLAQLVERLGPRAVLAAIEAEARGIERACGGSGPDGEGSTPDGRGTGPNGRGAEPDGRATGPDGREGGDNALLGASPEADMAVGTDLTRYAARLHQGDAERDLDMAARSGARLVCPEDDEWPDGLAVLTEAGELHGRGGPPLALWVRGDAELGALAARAVAIVGSRSASQYGLYVSSELAAGLADRGITVVSGAAFGIDAAAHRGALAACGPTIAVLASGVDVAYPRAHAALLDHIVAEGGLVVSEARPGSHPTRPRFLIRNRLIAALTKGTVIVEAALRSGALNTASWAIRCQREVMAVPGPVTSAESAGVHRLIRDGGAVLVTDAAEVAEQIGPMGQDLAPVKRGEERPRDRLDPRSLRVLEAVPAQAAQPVEPIASAAGLPVAETLAVLGRLWAEDFVERAAAGWRLSATERRRCRHPTSAPDIDASAPV